MTELEQALVHHEAGRLEEAEALYRAVLAREPEHPDALHLLGVIAHELGDHANARTLIAQAIAHHPGAAQYHYSLGEVLNALGETEAAIAAYARACDLDPTNAQAHNNRGIALHSTGRLPEAVAAFEEAIRRAPDLAEAHYNLGRARQESGALPEAIEAYEQALALEPSDPDAHNNLGIALAGQGRLREAIAAFEQALSLHAGLAEAHCNLGAAFRQQDRLEEGIAACRNAIALKPDYAEAHNNLGMALQAQGKLVEAIVAFREALSLSPEFAEAYNNLAVALVEQDKLSEAVASYERALSLQPDSHLFHYNLGHAYQTQGKLKEAIAAYQQALSLAPQDAGAHSNLLMCSNYRDDLDAQTMFTEHQRWAAQHADGLADAAQTYANAPDPQRRLRVGYVSPDLRRHPAAFFFEPLLGAHDPARIEVLCYAEVKHPDAVTARMKAQAPHWRSIVGLTDEAVAARIREDRVDILVDLAGHTANHRLLVFARKPAPIQVTYLGYPNTTGLTTMDYRFTDAVADPPGETDSFYTETLVRLTPGFACYCPPEEAPSVSALPANGTGAITFASLNNPAKIDSALIAIWAKILDLVPASRLMLQARTFADVATVARMQALFAKAGVGADRLVLLPGSALAEHLALYQQIDIALDTAPWNGHTTTCHALWMGVPVVTLAGERHAGRMAASVLSVVGLHELITSKPDEYVACAVSLAQGRAALGRLRSELREKVKQSPLIDAHAFTRHAETVYREMWVRWCETR
ncbi:MAG: tetratricopeptide repeat protein [Acidiferrobacterales bacterium]